MFGAFILVVLLVVVFSVAIWAAIDRETSDPTVVDRTEAEQRAREQGGLHNAQSSDRIDDRPDGRSAADDSHTESGWGSRTEADETWGRSEDESDGDDRWR